VPNIIGTLPLQYSVLADADWLSGPATLNCASANRGDTYKLSVCPLVSGTQWGTLTFMAPDGNYCWYSVEVRATDRHSHSAGVWVLCDTVAPKQCKNRPHMCSGLTCSV
jgi:hypothetical protein